MHRVLSDPFVPLPQAARALGVRWAVAYGLLLARKLDGELRGGRWYVEALSIARYLDEQAKANRLGGGQ
jgi:hypothetical protein